MTREARTKYLLQRLSQSVVSLKEGRQSGLSQLGECYWLQMSTGRDAAEHLTITGQHLTMKASQSNMSTAAEGEKAGPKTKEVGSDSDMDFQPHNPLLPTATMLAPLLSPSGFLLVTTKSNDPYRECWPNSTHSVCIKRLNPSALGQFLGPG